jgi:hypothetical protein
LARAYKTCPSKGKARSHEENNEKTMIDSLRLLIYEKCLRSQPLDNTIIPLENSFI